MIIKEVIKKLDDELGYSLDKKSIQYYDRTGIVCPARRKNGYRDYSEKDYHMLKIILLMKTLGYEGNIMNKIVNKKDKRTMRVVMEECEDKVNIAVILRGLIEDVLGEIF